MRVLLSTLILSCFVFSCTQKAEKITATAIQNVAENHRSYRLLEELTQDIGPRLSGSENAEKAVQWGLQKFQELGFDTAYLQEVMVPHWERGAAEQGLLLEGTDSIKLEVTALGGSVGTGANGITAEVIEVKNFKELADLGTKGVEGKVVFFNRPMDAKLRNTFRAYSLAVNQRADGAWQAAQYGAKAVLVRSMTTAKDLNPHTGTMNYRDSIQKIPAFAVATADADQLSERLKNGGAKVFLKSNCQWFPDALSHNVVGVLKGTKEEIIAVGGHLDSWDLGEGAHDDGAGIVHSIEALAILKDLGYQPKHTLRCVLFMNEENGAMGGKKYAEIAAAENEKHLLALESDRGGFEVEALSVQGNKEMLKKLQSWQPELAPNGVKEIYAGYGGVDISFLTDVDSTITLVGLVPNPEKYFNYHHTKADVLASVDAKDLATGAAAMAHFVLLADQNL